MTRRLRAVALSGASPHDQRVEMRHDGRIVPVDQRDAAVAAAACMARHPRGRHSGSVIVFDGRLRVHYGQAYVFSGDAEHPGKDLPACFSGQVNGLVGAAVPGVLVLVTGLHTGTVSLRVQVDDLEPPLDETWDEIVEVSFMPRPGEIVVRDWDGFVQCTVPIQTGSHRVRYSAAGMDEAAAADVVVADEPTIDRYLLSFWPSQPRADEIVKQTSRRAAYWHTSRGTSR